MYALLPARWQTSRATSGVSLVPAGLVIRLQVGRDAILGEHVEEWRLIERDGQRGFQRVVEHGIAGAVGEVGDNDGVLVGQPRRALRAIVEPANDNCDQQSQPAAALMPQCFVAEASALGAADLRRA